MFDPKDFPFNPEKIAEFFKSNDFAKSFGAADLTDRSAEIVAAQKKNMAAFVAANKSAAMSYQALFTKQLEIFETALAKAEVPSNDADPDTQAAKAKSSFDDAMKHMQGLATDAHQANAEALEIIGERMKEAVAEIKKAADSKKD